MKKEFRSACLKAIKESNLNGYKWAVTPNGLGWSYCDVHFAFLHDAEKGCFYVYDDNGAKFVCLLIGEEFYCDAKTLEEAYYKATCETISKANYLY